MDKLDSEKMVQRIRVRLAEIGQTQTWLAKQAGITKPCLSNYMNGRRRTWRAEVVFRIANALDLTYEYLIYGVGPGAGIREITRQLEGLDDRGVKKILRGMKLPEDYIILIMTLREKELSDRELSAIDLILTNAADR